MEMQVLIIVLLFTTGHGLRNVYGPTPPGFTSVVLSGREPVCPGAIAVFTVTSFRGDIARIGVGYNNGRNHVYFYNVFSVPVSSYPMRIDIPDPAFRCFELVMVSANGTGANNEEFTFQFRVNYSATHSSSIRHIEAGSRSRASLQGAFRPYTAYFDFRGNFLASYT